MMRRALRMYAGPTGSGDREERRRDIEPSPRQRVQRELRGGGEAPRHRDRLGVSQRRARDIREAVDKAVYQFW